jgi:integrase/recombinase XerD
MISIEPVGSFDNAEKGDDFVSANENAKCEIVASLVRMARRERLDYDDFLYVCQQARRKLGLRRPKRGRILPKVLSESDLQRFFQAIQGDVEHEIMFKLLFFTAIRVSELVHIRVSDLDLGNCKIFINQGKGSKDRYILFPLSFRLILSSHLQSNPKNRYLFETSRFGPYTTRRVQQIVQAYRLKAGIEQRVTPHLFRHQMITALTRSGLSDAQIQLISGHSSKKSLEIYQHVGLEAVEQAYQDAVQIAERSLNGALYLAGGTEAGNDATVLSNRSCRLQNRFECPQGTL